MTELSLELRPSGLYPDPNPHTDVPAGALVEASDVVIRRQGVLQPRPGLEDQSYGSMASRYIQAIHPFDGDFITATKAAGGDNLLNKDGTAITLDGADVTFADYHVHSAIFRDRAYVPSSDGLLRVDGADATTATIAGLPRAKSGFGELVEPGRSADEWLEGQAGTVAYRCILADEDADGSLRLGPPSGRWRVKASTTSSPSGDRAVQLTIPVHSDWAGYEVQVYRSEISSTDTPSDEMGLAFRHTISAAEATAGFFTVVDETPENERGAALYTNGSQQGAAGEHRQPPTLGTVATYRDILFGGRVTGRSSIVLPFTLVPTNWFNDSGTGETVDVTNASTALANQSWPQSSDLYGLAITELGFNPQDADTYFSADTEISYTSGGGWVLSANALASSTGQDVELCEWIDVNPSGGSAFRVYFRGSSSDADIDLAELTVYANDAGLGAALYDLERVIGSLAYVINRTDETITAAHLGNGVLLIESVDVGDDMDITLPRRLAANVGFDIAGETATATKTSDADLKPNRLIWSALQVPEGFPPLQFLDLGSETHPILALQATQFGVYAFKYDGIWRIDGRTPTSLSAERVASARLCAPKCVDEFNGEAYAWTDQGLVRVGSGGISDNLTDAALDVWLGPIQQALPEGFGIGAFLSIDRADGVFYLGAPATAAADVSEYIYTMDIKPAAWTRWDLDATDVATIDGRLYVSIYGAFGTEATTAGRLLRARLASDDYPHHDDSGTATVDSESAGVITVSGSGYKANVGDWFVTDNDVSGVITAVSGIPGFGTVDLTVTYVENAGDIGAASTITIYLGPDCIVEWTTRTGTGIPLQTKRFSTVSLSFEELDRFYEADWSFYSDHSETADTATWTRTPEADRVRPEVWRGGFVPRGAASAAHLRARVAMHNPGATWALTSLGLAYQPAGIRAGRRAP